MSTTTAAPATWMTTRLGWLFQPISDRGHQDAMVLSVYRDHGVIPKDSRTDNFNRTPENLSNYQLVRAGDLVVNRMKAWQGSLGISEHEGIVSPDYEVLRPTAPTCDGRFLHQLLRSRGLIDQYGLRSTGVRPSQWRLYWEEMKTIEISVPSAEEQRAIADYLDRETARIDTLIEEQQRLIELLRERRAALIANETGWGATGSNEWPMMRLSWLFQRTSSGTTPANEEITYDEDADVPWVTTGELRESIINRTARGVSFEVVERYSALKAHPAGSLLIAMYGATIGRMALLGVDATSNQACCALVEPTQSDPEFVQYSLMSAKSRLLMQAAGGGQPNINQDKIRAFRIPTPPVEGQRRIAAYLDAQTARIDELIAETERVIELSRERRSALITAAVTGQIDVRGTLDPISA